MLRGVFLSTRAELDWFYGGGAGAFYPDLWARFVAAVSEEERGDLISAYHRRLFSGNLLEETKAARVWAAWENALASVQSFMDGYARTGATRPRAADLAWATAWQLLCRRLWRCCVNLKPGRFALVAPLLSLAETLAAQGHVEAAGPAPRGRTGPTLSAPRAVQ